VPQVFQDVRFPKLQDGTSPAQDKLAKFVVEKLDQVITSRSSQLSEKLLRYENNYMGKPRQETRTTPFYGASNFVSGMIRMHTDIYHARVMGFVFGVKPFWQPSYFSSQIKDKWCSGVADWMEFQCWNKMQFFEPLDTAFHSMIKLGTNVLKAPWVERELWSATTEREGTTKSISQKFNNVAISPIHYADFLTYPVNARTLSQVLMKFHRLRFTEEEVRYRQVTRGWDKSATDMLLRCPVLGSTPADTSIANRSGIQLSVDVTRPFQIIECHLDWELEPGKLFPLIVLFNPHITNGKAILRVYHKTYKELDLDEFIDLHYTTGETEFYKDGVPAILEGHFEEHTQLHCDRRDSSTIANIPSFIKKRFANVGNPKDEWYPGKVWEVDSMDDLRIDKSTASYNGMIDEEHEIMGQAERLVGNPPPTQGMGSGSMGKRGVYNTGGTLALLGEGNRRLDLLLQRCRIPMHKLGRLIYCSHRDFDDDLRSSLAGPKGNDANALAAFNFSPPAGSAGSLWFGLNASNSTANREVERTSLLMAGQTLSSYYQQLFQLMQQVVSAPEGSPVKQVGLMVLDGARSLADSILRAFNVPDHQGLLPDLREVLAGGQPGGGPPPPGAENLPPAQSNVQPRDVGSLSDSISKIAASSRGNGAVPQGRPAQ
jgi:hypothetical protein